MLGRAVLLLAAATLAAGPARADYPVTDEQLTSVQAFRSSPLVSDDGSKIAYAYWQYRSPGVLLGRIQARLIDRSTRTERSMSMLPDGSISHRTWPTAISGDGRSIALLSASRLTDDAPDRGEPYLGIYLYDVARARPSFVGVAAELMPEGISSLSRDGRIASGRDPSFHPVVLDVPSGSVTTVAQAEGAAIATALPRVSADGSTLVFTAGDSPALDPRDRNGFFDVYAYDLAAGAATLVSVSADGGAADADSSGALVSSDGTTVVFSSGAATLTSSPSCVADPGSDAPCVVQVFARDLTAGRTEIVSVSNGGLPGDRYSYDHRISADARFVVFRTSSTLIDPTNELPATSSPFAVRDRLRGTTLPMLGAAQRAIPFLDARTHAFSGDGRTFVYVASTLLDGDAFNLYATGNPSLLAPLP